MGKGSGLPAEAGTPCKIRIDDDLLAWLDHECERKDRSRSYLINEMLRLRMRTLERRRKDGTAKK